MNIKIVDLVKNKIIGKEKIIKKMYLKLFINC